MRSRRKTNNRVARGWMCVLIAATPLTGIANDNLRGDVMELRGFQVDFRLATKKQQEAMLSSLNKQFDIVAETQVPAAVMEFFRTIPIVVNPALQGSLGRAQMFRGRQIVQLQPVKMPADRPIVLHELLHGYYSLRLRSEPAIPEAYQHALDESIYPARFRRAHFLDNANEYFTVVATVYLFDKRLDQPPFDCSIPAKEQPEFIAFLGEHFGPRKCK